MKTPCRKYLGTCIQKYTVTSFPMSELIPYVFDLQVQVEVVFYLHVGSNLGQ